MNIQNALFTSNMRFMDTIEDIYHHGFHIMDNFLAEQDYRALLNHIQKQDSLGILSPAKIGKNAQLQTAIRGDKIHWLEQNNRVFNAYFLIIEQLRLSLNKALFLGLTEFETHTAIYESGAFYKKHVDQFATTQTRRISCVYYLNQNWQPEHGGELVLYNKDHEMIQCIQPIKNRFACFMSDLPHEVSITTQKRYSITGWLKVRT